MEPVLTRAARRGAAGDPPDRALRLARRTVGPGGGLRADLGGVGDRQVGGAADRRRAAFRAAGRHGRRARAAPVEKRRLLSRAGRHLRGEADAVQSLGRIQGAPRALEGPRGLLTDQARAPGRRSPGDDPRGARRAAHPLQCRLRRHVAVDGGPLGRRAAPGTAAAGTARAAGNPDSHATCDWRPPRARSCSSCSGMRC